MITFARSFDYTQIGDILRHDRIYPHISDDYSPPASEYRPVESEAVWYVIARNVEEAGTDLLGLWMFCPESGITWAVHTCLLPIAWGPVGLEAARQLPAWIWEHACCRRIITSVPTTNRLALRFAIRAGMKIYGVNEASWLKNGKLVDMVCLGLSPGDRADRNEGFDTSRLEEECRQL